MLLPVNIEQTLYLKIKLVHPNAVVPQYAKAGDAALDLTAVSKEVNDFTGQVIYDTGIAVEIPEGHFGMIAPRSSICKKKLRLSNSIGIIDSGYRGTIKAVFNSTGSYVPLKTDIYEIGERICQLIILPYPKIEIQVVDELSDTDRDQGGFGSSGV